MANRLVNGIVRTRCRVYVGVRKKEPARHDSNALFERMLREAVADRHLRREDCEPAARILLALYEHPGRGGGPDCGRARRTVGANRGGG